MDPKETKERMKIPRQAMPEQDPKERVGNFYEVPYGYTPELAIEEARRCIQCKNPLCVGGCPVNIDIPWFIRLIAEGKFVDAARKLKETNALPAVCGRVCPQEDQCEKVCIVGKKGQPVSIGRLERFAADYEREHAEVSIPDIPKWTGKKVAVVGGGPAGVTVAGDLVKKGHKVTIFEALHVAGGVLMYGIPEFRLPKKIVESEIEYVKKMGVEIICNAVIGKLETIDELLSNSYDAVFIGTGAGLPTFMNIPGENLIGVYSANEYLTRVNLMRAYQFPEYDTPVLRGKKVVVIDDSIVRGTTSRKIVKMIRDAGAKEVHMRISSPPTVCPCFYGIDTPTKKELIASSHTIDEVNTYITADTLRYLSIEGLYKAVSDAGASFCDACFTGKYPVEFPVEGIEPQMALFK